MNIFDGKIIFIVAAAIIVIAGVFLYTSIDSVYAQMTEFQRMSECNDSVNEQLQLMKNAIEATANEKQPTYFEFDLPNCPNQEKSSLSIIGRDNTTYCTKVCGKPVRQCTSLQFDSPEYHKAVCLDISSATSFASEEYGTAGRCNNSPITPFKLTDLKNYPIPPGEYYIADTNNYTSPIICAYS